MKSWKILAIVMALGFIIYGIGFAEMAAEQERTDIAAHSQEADINAQAAMPESVELTGTILSDNTFVDENGDNYQLADSERNEELLELVGQRIKVTATVKESEEGMKNISVTDYELLQE